MNAGEAADAVHHVAPQSAHRGPRKMRLGEAGIEFFVIGEFAGGDFRIGHYAIRRGLRRATHVRNSEPASIEPSRNSVHLEIGSPGPKQPQLISWWLRKACSMAAKKIARVSETAVAERRSSQPKISNRPSATSNHGMVRARGSM